MPVVVSSCSLTKDKSSTRIGYFARHYTWYNGKRINNPNTHGTGCTLSSAIAANLAKGFDLDASVKRAKDYISGALAAMLDLGKGSGPMNHAFDIQSKFTKENSEAEQ